VDNNPNGREYGTVEVRLEEAARKDELLAGFAQSIHVQVSHTQSVVRLPPGAVLLASSAREANHAYRVGSSAWGVQFHPEFDAEIMRAYIRNQSKALRAEGQDPDMLFSETRDTPFGSEILRRFAAMTRRLG
jgi:GMP synthase (glutamine-hydrolysing)